MTSLKMLETVTFRLGLLLLVRGGWWNVLFLLEGIISLVNVYKEGKGSIDQRVLLEQLASFGNRLREGDAPVHAWERANVQSYPREFIHPEAEHFSLEIYEKQFRLFEKKLLLEEELDAEFAASRLRMGIMKYLPILSMLMLEGFSGRITPLALRIGCGVGLLLNYHVATRLEKPS
ncbi:MAG TPA: hypothetical protein GX733_07275 [Tissierellia bacterium]|nr:hypothetical protein [Tissierellia bacterium]